MIELFIAMLIVGLGAARLTLIFTSDVIMESLRDKLFLLSPPEDNADLGRNYQMFSRVNTPNGPSRKVLWMKYEFSPHTYRKAGFFGSLFSCPDCLGVWIGFMSVALVYYIPVLIYFYIALSVSMIISLISRKYNDSVE